MARSALLLVLWATAAMARPLVLLFPAVGQPLAVTVSGRVLKDAPTSGSNPLSRNLRRLTASDWEDAALAVTFDGQTQTTRSGHDGVFEVTFRAPPSQPFRPGMHPVTAQVQGAISKTTVKVLDDRAAFFVISDFDDTMAVSNVVHRRELLKAALLQDADTQPVVEGMPGFYRCLVEAQRPETALAVVTGSPHQYVGRIAHFLARHGFPLAGIYPRDLGLDTLSDYKQPVIRKLLQGTKQPVVLIGDSGEHDPEVYVQIRKEFPGRVRAIYLRDAGGDTSDPARFEGALLFHHLREAAKDALARGLISKRCYDTEFPEEPAQ